MIPGIGKSMATKIVEIMDSGHLRKLDQFGESVSVLELFTNIWGVGAKTAQLWYQQVRLDGRTNEPVKNRPSQMDWSQMIDLSNVQWTIE